MKSKNLLYAFALALILVGATIVFIRRGSTAVVRVEGMALSPDGTTLAVILTSFHNVLAPVPTISGTRHWIRLYDPSTWSYRDIDGTAGSPIAFSPDGTRLATGQASGHGMGDVAMLWDMETLEVVHILKPPPRSDLPEGVSVQGGAWSLDFSPDGRYLAVSGMGDSAAKVWTVTGGELVAAMEHDEGVLDARFSPDGRTLFTASNDGRVRVWDLSGSELLQTLHAHDTGVRVMAFSRDGTILATGSRDGTLSLWDVGTMTLKHRRGGHAADVEEIVFSPDDRIVAAGTGMDAGSPHRKTGMVPGFSVALRSTESGKMLSILTGHTGHLSIAFSHDGNSLFTGGSLGGMLDQSPDGTIRVWSVPSGKMTKLIRPNGEDSSLLLILCGCAAATLICFWIRAIRRYER